ncbi:MAG: Molybdopterin dehydrogenase, partial [Bradyrhizobium sp.]|nr:Molybdopterin dehydrogenase [Bradyrhizobium sp.]
MKASAFSYVKPSTVQDALALLAQHGEAAKLLSGGQSLMPALNLR